MIETNDDDKNLVFMQLISGMNGSSHFWKDEIHVVKG